jgi:hypothetical protein
MSRNSRTANLLTDNRRKLFLVIIGFVLGTVIARSLLSGQPLVTDLLLCCGQLDALRRMLGKARDWKLIREVPRISRSKFFPGIAW